ncbi:Exopolyphosphatase [Agromyces sp. NDB4Y10]|uniref:Ppx/GppA phosphatase family protein n=1 Tax=Agromyces indicus TaxID=758919 RepID=A0ABU1FIX3_9MICO|nr:MULTISPECIES: Ppx/GppA phosphatase family protein [Agromyces]KZE92260.1 Exopolyphosphatase [Agromyces sp. NDB4Y10]MDR5691715.1 Ppx/GppA phosphatase family protein [Agromyces indicus]
MRLGVLDVGSNTVHLLVVDAHPGARPIPAASNKSVLRLMRYLDDDGAITEEGVDALLAAVTEGARVAREAGIDEMLAFATSAIREAANGPEVLQRIEDAAGIRLDVLSGPDEARITFLAVRRWYGWSAGRVLLFDIGGGSLEIAHGGDEIPDAAQSVPLGAGRSTIRFLPDDPPSEAQVKRLREHARGLLEATVDEFGGIPASDHVVGSSKTIRSLAKLAGSTEEGVGSEERSILKLSHLDDWIPRLARIPADARPALPGITEDRTFQIVAGAIVLSETMHAFKAKTLEVSPWALREGLILRRLDRLG